MSNSSNYKLEFTLKQHTPIIHFQADQKGATLRATELKPKLDRFLIDKLKMLDENKKPLDKYKSWFIGEGKQHLALDYKVKIVNNGNNTIDFPKASVRRGEAGYVAAYFADDGKSIEHIIDSVRVFIASFNESILNEIDDKIDLFFTFENFGTRQSKGFGSYHLNTTTEEEFEKKLLEHENKVFKFTKVESNAKFALKSIDTFYKYLKMGQREDNNRGISYEKSLLFQFMCKEYDIGWEKKYLKTKYPEIIHGDKEPIVCTEPEDKEYKYIRALLGLAEHNEYRPDSGKKQIKIESVDRDERDTTKARYQRFKSPITFKVFNNSIYLIYNKSYEEILNKEFYFKLQKKREKLFTPEKFNIYKFLQFVEKKVVYFKELK